MVAILTSQIPTTIVTAEQLLSYSLEIYNEYYRRMDCQLRDLSLFPIIQYETNRTLADGQMGDIATLILKKSPQIIGNELNQKPWLYALEWISVTGGLPNKYK